MTNDNQHIPAGYKPSPLGPIPEDWEVKRLEDLGSFKNGLNFSPNEEGCSYYFLGVGDFLENNIIHANCLGQIHLKEELAKEYLLNNDDLVFVRSNGSKSLVGRCVIIHADHVKATYSGFCIRFRTTGEETSTRYIKHIIDAGYLQRFLQYEGRGTNITNLNQEILGRLTFPLPDLKEQQNILNALSLWDTAIAKQTALIEQLTLRKRGLMQQLLTGKKRLKGFEGKWKEVRLGEMGAAYSGLTNKNKDDFENGNALFVTYMNVFSNAKVDKDNLGQVQIHPSEKQEKVQYGDIFFTVSSETPDEVGMASVLLNEVQNTYLNSFCFGYRLNDFKTLVPEYASYLLRGDGFRKEIYKIAQGSTRFNISKTEVLNMRIIIPSIEEQNAIASVLIQSDKEIEIHKQKLAAMQTQKKGLMQVLLTGKRRIK